MTKRPSIVKLLLGVVAVPVAATPLIAYLFVGVGWKEIFSSAILMNGIAYSACIGLPCGLILPLLARRIGRPGTRLAFSISVAIVLLAALGCLAAGWLIQLLGFAARSSFWHLYWVNLRITATLALVFGMGSYFYQALATQLQESRAQLALKELESERAGKLALEARLASLESRIHPHFLFNTLNSISSLIPVNPARAEAILGQLAALLRSSLDTTRQRTIPLDAELQIVRDYLEIEKARFGDRLRYRLDVSPQAKPCMVPPFSVQCLVENAVKHGGPEIEVAIGPAYSGLRVEVCDNGPGFDLASVPAGHGIENLVSRLDSLYGSSARLEVTARRDGWCVVSLLIPADVAVEA